MNPRPNLIWAVPGVFDRISEWISIRLRAVFSQDSSGAKCLELTEQQAWQTDFSAPVKNSNDLKAALVQALPSLSPIPIDKAVVYAASHSTEANHLNLLVLLKDTHAELLAKHDGYHAFSQKGVLFPFKRTISRKRMAAGLSVALIIALFLLGDTLLNAGIRQNQAKLAYARSEERGVLADLKTRSDIARQQTASEQFLAAKPDHLTPSGRLTLLETLSEATPDTSYWQSINIGQDEVSVEISSVDAAGDLSALQSSLPNWELDLTGPISATQTGRERMTVTLLRLKYETEDSE